MFCLKPVFVFVYQQLFEIVVIYFCRAFDYTKSSSWLKHWTKIKTTICCLCWPWIKIIWTQNKNQQNMKLQSNSFHMLCDYTFTVYIDKRMWNEMGWNLIFCWFLFCVNCMLFIASVIFSNVIQLSNGFHCHRCYHSWNAFIHSFSFNFSVSVSNFLSSHFCLSFFF